MKKILFYVFIFLLIFNLSAQNEEKIDKTKYKITYLLRYRPDTTNTELILKERMFLFLGKEKSKFISEGFNAIDSVAKKMERDGSTTIDLGVIFNKIPRSKFKDVIYKNHPKEEITVTDAFGGTYYLYREPNQLFQWKIDDETKDLNGYRCQKATTSFGGRNYEAWFTQDIPIADGPYKFNGLPGLIVTIADDKYNYSYGLIDVLKSDEDMIFNNRNFVKTTKSELLTYKKEFYKNFVQSASQRGLTLDMDASEKKALNRKLSKRNNNPIEILY